MSKSFKSILSLTLASVLTMSFLLVGMTVFGEDLVEVNAVNFPDNNFRRVVSECFDRNNDGFLDSSERSNDSVTMFDLSGILEDQYGGMTVASIEGIELFNGIETLHAGGIGLESLDASALPDIKYLYCGGNDFTSLDVSNCTRLVALYCGGGEVDTLTLPSTDTLRVVHCYSNMLHSLDVSMLTGLENLNCNSNELTALNLSNNTNLTKFQCADNHITSLDLSNTAITTASTTPAMIGSQNLEIIASTDSGSYVVPFGTYGLTNENYLFSNLDEYGEGYGFDGSRFFSATADAVRNGIDYSASTGKEDAPELQVHLKTAYQVDFYYDSDYYDYVGSAFALPGETAVAPELEWIPKCKALDTWSESIDNVQEDMSVYAVWKDAHTFVLLGLEDDLDTLDFDCSVCSNNKFTKSFKSLINAHDSDERFILCVDVNSDSYINAKDYSLIYNDYKQAHQG